MAKLFPIGIEVEEIAVGSVLRILNKTPGVAKLHLNLMNENASTIESDDGSIINEIQNTLPPVRPPKHGSMQMVLAKILSVTPCHNNVLKEALVRNGFSATSLASQVTQMRSKGWIKRVGIGTWRLTDKGSRHYGLGDFKLGATKPSKHARRNGPQTNNGYGVRKLVLTALNGKELVAKELRKILEDHEYSPKNMTGTVGKMRGEGLVTSNGGIYSLTDQGRSVLNEVAANPMEQTLES